MIQVRPMPHGVYYGYVNCTRVCWAVRCDPVEAAYVAIRNAVAKHRRCRIRDRGQCGKWFQDRPTYRVRRDRDWYLYDDDAFFHWTPGDHLPRRHRS